MITASEINTLLYGAFKVAAAGEGGLWHAEVLKLIPVYDEQGDVLLYDMYADGEWLGSRRTELMCEEYLRWLYPNLIW